MIDYDYLCIRTPFCATDRDAHGKVCIRANDTARREHYEAEFEAVVWTDEAIEALGIPVIGDRPIHHPSCPRRHDDTARCLCVETLTR